MFMLNCWYVASWSHDLDSGRLHTVGVAGVPLVLYRRGDGTIAALLDRCPHRFAPLSMGRLEGDTLRCMYHGIRFGSDGGCVEVPEQTATPAALQVRSFPVVERHGFVWIWPGEASLADTDVVPEVPYLEDDVGYRHKFGRIDYDANYLAVCDNLLDLSHVAFLHENTLAGGATQTSFKSKVIEIPRGVRVSYWKRGGAAGAASRRTDGALTDVFNTYDFVVPGIFKLRSRAYPDGTADLLDDGIPPDGMAPLLDDVSGQAVTPMTGRRSRYFFSFGQRADTGAPRLDGIWSVVGKAFEEDRRMIEAQQRMVEAFPGDRMVGIAADKGVALFRRIVDRLIEQESRTRAAPAAVTAE